MRIRELKAVIFLILLIFLLLQCGIEATNYVILSWTKEGLRELRLAYRGRRVLATSLASVRSSNSVVFTQATNGLRLVETVIRYGAIDDCIVSSSYRDVLFFSSEFAQVQPGAMLHTEEDIMDVYLGVKNLTDPVFPSKHSNTGDATTANTSIINSNNGVYSSYTSMDTAEAAAYDSPSFVLSAKIISPKNSSFWKMFKRNLQVMKMSRECVQFQKQAAQTLEMLLLLPSDFEGRPLSSPAHLNNSERNGKPPSLHHRRRHHHGEHLLRRHDTHIADEVVGQPQDRVNMETKHTQYQRLSEIVNITKDNFLSTLNTSADLGNPLTRTLQSGDVERTTESSDSSLDTLNTEQTTKSSFSSLGIGKTEQTTNISISSIGTEDIDHTTESSISSLGTKDTEHNTESSISSLSTGDTEHNTKNSISSLGTGDTENAAESSVSSQLTPYSTKSPIQNKDVASKHSTTVLPVNGSLETSSPINSNADNISHNDMYKEQIADNISHNDMYKEQIADMNKTADSASPGSPHESSGHLRQKRDLLTGWMIFPGTKWCGDGDIAENKHDMGYHVELDKCCRRHDLCPLVISRLTWKYGMFNYRLHTLSHCRCDRKFRKCLKASSSPLAHLIGQIYFNVVGPQCFKFSQQSTCVQRHWWGGCQQYANNKVAFAKKQRRFK